jgi:hypothetical protein
VDDGFLEDSFSMTFGWVVLKHKSDWVANFSHYEVGGDVLLVELRIIHIEIGLEFYRYKGYNNIVCENASNRNY